MIKKTHPQTPSLEKRRGSIKSLSFHPEGIFGKGELFKSSPDVMQPSKLIGIPVIESANLILNRTLMNLNNT